MKSETSAPKRSWRERLAGGLRASRERLTAPLNALFGRKTLSADELDELESALISADVGVAASQSLIAELNSRWKRADGNADPRVLLRDALVELLAPIERPLVIGGERPFVIMIVGVNGAGKTTSIGKLTKHLQAQGLSVLLAAGDTFRAAAREQLAIWGERNDVHVISQQSADPAAVIYDAIASADRKSVV